MKLASYKGIRSGIMGLGSHLIRWRLNDVYSHSEIIFEPGDGVDHLMPDGTTEPQEGYYWAVSSTGLEKIPSWSNRRAGKTGGVRFKRIKFEDAKWDIQDLPSKHFDAVKVAKLARRIEGALYDWQLILGFIAFFIPNKKSRFMCSEVCAYLLEYSASERYDPSNLHSFTDTLLRWLK